MQPFHVTCETCGARLKVRDPAVIGEIHACPRCDSMVLIAAPVGWNAPTDGPTSTPSPARSATNFARVVPPSEVAADAFAAAAALAATPNIEAATSACPDAPAETPAEAVSATSSRPAFLTSSKLAWRVAAGATVFLAGGLVSVLVLSSNRPDTERPVASLPAAAVPPAGREVVHEAETATTTIDDPTPPSLDLPEHPVEVVVAKPTSAAEGQETTAAEPPVADALPSEAGVGEVPSASREAESGDVAPPGADSEAPAAAAQAATPVPPVVRERPAPVLKFDPLGFDPSQLSLEAISAASTVPSAGSTAAEPPSEAEVASAAPQERPAEEIGPPPAEAPSVTVRLGPQPSDRRAPMEIVQALSLRIEAFRVNGMPLERFVRVVSDMLGLPITLEPAALQLAGTTTNAPVAVEAAQTSLEQLLQGALARQRLELVDDQGHLTIRLAAAAERLTKLHDVADLVAAGEQQVNSVAATIERFVAPSTWKSSGGTGTLQVQGTTLRVEQSKAVQHEIVIFCERLRLARGLRQRTKYPADRLMIDSPYRTIDRQLSERTTFTFLPWTRLADVVQHWEDASRVAMLVDWSTLSDEQLLPSTPVACSALEQPWTAALEQILEPLGLTWWAVDGRTLQITTREALADIQRTEFYVIPPSYRDQFTSDTAMIESLRAELQQQSDGHRADNSRITIQVDGPSRRLVVRASPQLHQRITQLVHNAERELEK